jgi:hypothetical protein
MTSTPVLLVCLRLEFGSGMQRSEDKRRAKARSALLKDGLGRAAALRPRYAKYRQECPTSSVSWGSLQKQVLNRLSRRGLQVGRFPLSVPRLTRCQVAKARVLACRTRYEARERAGQRAWFSPEAGRDVRMGARFWWLGSHPLNGPINREHPTPKSSAWV